MKKSIFALISTTCAAVLLVVLLSATAPMAKADDDQPSCGYNGVFVPTGGGAGYCSYPDDPPPPPPPPPPTITFCDGNALAFYYWGMSLYQYIDPYQFYLQFGCYPN